MAKDEVEVEVGGEKIRITSPNRVVFPRQGWTKMDVVEHFLAVVEGAFRGIADRPTMLKRYMSNVDEDPVYQKRASKNTPFDTVQIRFPSQRPGLMNVPRTEADVIRLVQLGCLDFHPWPVRADDIDHPDELRFDFDPTPGFGFDDVRRAVAGAKELLDEVGLSDYAEVLTVEMPYGRKRAPRPPPPAAGRTSVPSPPSCAPPPTRPWPTPAPASTRRPRSWSATGRPASSRRSSPPPVTSG